MSVKENLQLIQENIAEVCRKTNRDPSEIKIIAVTKYVSIETAQSAIAAGIEHIGENRDNGLNQKWEIIGEHAIWHFIGTLQTRKVKNIIDKVDYIHSLDRLSLAEEINKRAENIIKCFVQVNAANEESKQGLSVGEVVPFIENLKDFPLIKVVGLMTMAPFIEDEGVLRETFSKVKKLQKDVQALNLPYAPCEELSMGMSNDYKIAIEEGATMIRIGTSLVGKEF
ncbi:pyridoxal phosphate enzyme, YggS family [Schinkia azotoformans MEV2011]|uniref:Pyridoxal phosphate homeostasis protein n=1 Tax=Schinkia azotoformans MEV2011 TaxID=1348973 RepID=A0A072NLW1_SCHAZ|nr:YggS family pyridoxal phosphate-dependent enzyme [Schinkia azotoformans]KEF38629.1 pyridoxal phosphate enzyme, YggS family [Schinkia azotoformans MEV2011]MEC1698057.1 YggS family pyridoxal phosphate-dependent enzyme [Schinkia azotoformans]MEC1715379.1 YggS family pyridoxal phosphate-dependent enzyme [Schinkia azotoformans]MEC1727539.1 YggS family pyridoxal phosphate-dependent enzyme [Schinkia azotoformans]MEC1740871.1 YggS family pyridoxal phosphate-dependent enzyme [Schinkia azotoformans]